MNHPSLLVTALLVVSLPSVRAAATLAPGTEGPAPAAHCLDASNVAVVRQAKADSVAVRTGDGKAFRLEFIAACPGIMDGTQVGLDTPGGWACGRPGERLMVDGRSCGISAVAPIDSRAFAEVARESSRQHLKTLPGVTVTARSIEEDRRRRFRGSPDFCFATRNVRGWNTSGKGITVETNPRRNAGNRFYRVEVGGGCRNFSGIDTVEFVSGLKNGLVCGNPGDSMVAVVLSVAAMIEVPSSRSYCPVTAVYPVN